MDKAKDQHPWFGKWQYVNTSHRTISNPFSVGDIMYLRLMQHRHWTRVHSSGPGWSPLWMAQEWLSWAPGLWNSSMKHYRTIASVKLISETLYKTIASVVSLRILCSNCHNSQLSELSTVVENCISSQSLPFCLLQCLSICCSCHIRCLC